MCHLCYKAGLKWYYIWQRLLWQQEYFSLEIYYNIYKYNVVPLNLVYYDRYKKGVRS